MSLIKTSIFLILCSSLVTSLKSFAEGRKIEVRFQNFSTVNTAQEIYLEDLIVETDKSHQFPEPILGIAVADRITEEQEISVKGSEIAKRIRQALSFQDLQSYSFVVPEVITIKGKRNFISPHKLKRSILARAQFLCQSCEVKLDDFQFNQGNLNSEILSYRLELENMRGGGSFLIPILFDTSQGKIQSQIQGKVSFYQEGLVAKRYLTIGASLSLEDFERKKVNVTFSKDGVPDTKKLAGMILARPLTRGQALFQSDLKPEVVTSRGQVVKILIEGENYEIAVQGIAEQAGSVGDLIQVKNLNNNKTISAVIVDRGLVRLQ